MKKALSVLLVSIVLAFCASALDLNINLGVVSGVGVSHDAGQWQFGLDLESTFPVFSTFNAIMAQKYEDAEFGEGFRIGSTYFFGADGRMVRDLGSFMRKLSGMVVVQETINYYAPLRSQVFEALQPVLEEIQAH